MCSADAIGSAEYMYIYRTYTGTKCCDSDSPLRVCEALWFSNGRTRSHVRSTQYWVHCEKDKRERTKTERHSLERLLLANDHPSAIVRACCVILAGRSLSSESFISIQSIYGYTCAQLHTVVSTRRRLPRDSTSQRTQRKWENGAQRKEQYETEGAASPRAAAESSALTLTTRCVALLCWRGTRTRTHT